MKWKNKGREFDKSQIVSMFQACEHVYIYGAGEYGKDLYEKMYLVHDIISFIDSDNEMQKNGYAGRLVISPSQMDEIDFRRSIIIVAASAQNTAIIKKQLYMRGLEKIVFSYLDFIQYWLPLFIKYKNDLVYFQDLTILITEKCTLRCKHCAPMYPYLENPKHRNFEEIVEDVDALFEQVDYVWDLIFTGGEPFLSPFFYDIMAYVLGKFKHRFHHIQIITNGSVLPDEKFISVLTSNNVYLSISDYTSSLKLELADRIKKNIFTLKECGVNIEIPHVEHWCDFGFKDKNRKERNQEELIQFFDDCNSSCRAFHKKHFIYCVPALYADIVVSGKNLEQWDTDNFFVPENKMQLIEWQCGYSNKGYLDMCKNCNGYITINRTYVPAGEQL